MQAFLSYAHSDPSRHVVQQITQAMERAGIRVWTDTQIRAGDDFIRAMNSALRASDLFLVLLSPGYLTSRFCMNELESLLNERRTDKRPVIPIILGGAEAPPALSGFESVDGRNVGDDHLAAIIASAAQRAVPQGASTPAA